MVVDLPAWSYAKVIKGIYNSTYKTVATDTDGNIVMILKDPTNDRYVAVDASGFLTAVMKGNDSGTLRTIAVDSDGNIVGIFKGDYEGALKTLAVDSGGRIQAVLTDPEDVFGNPHYMGAGELAARLGAIATYDRRGTLVWQDDFEDNINKWDVDYAGSGGSAALSTDTARNGAKSAKLTAGDGQPYYISLSKLLPLPITTKLGFECSFTIHNDVSLLWLRIGVYDGALEHNAYVQYNPAADTLVVNNTTSTTTIDTGLALHDDVQMFHTMKIVMDYATKKHVRVLLNEQEYDTSAIGYYITADLRDPLMFAQVHYRWSGQGSIPSIYVDDAIVTQNEE